MRKMKDSRVKWIGEIPDSWEIKPIRADFKEVTAKNKYGQVKNALKFTYGEIVSKDNFCAEDDEYVADTILNYTIVEPDTIMLNCLNLNFDFVSQRIGLVKQKGVITSAYLAFKPNTDRIISRYATYLFKSYDNCKAFHNMGGGVRKILNFEELKKELCLFPPVCEQQAISDFLDEKCSEIDALTADIQKQIEVLEEYKKSLVFRAVSRGIKDIALKETGLEVWMKIPENWQLVDIKYIFEIVKRVAGREGYNVLSVTQKGLKIKDIESNNGQQAENYSGYQFVYPTDYVMNHMDLLTGWVDCSTMFGVTSPDYRVFRLRDKENNDLIYFKHLMQCCYMSRIFYSLGQGVSNLGRWRLQTSSFNNFMIPVPPLKEQQQIAAYLDGRCSEIDSIIKEKQQQLETLAEYKKSLIYEYVTGKKEVI